MYYYLIKCSETYFRSCLAQAIRIILYQNITMHALVMFLAEKDFLSMNHKRFMMKQILHPFSRLFVPES